MNNKLENIKKIRKITKISIYKCKKILEKNNFDIYKSLKYLKKKKLNKKNKSYHEFITTKTKKNITIIIKFESETDFIINNIEFKNFEKKIICNIINNYKKYNIDSKNINKIFKNDINLITNKLNENIKIKNFLYLKSNKEKYICDYNHNRKIGVIILVKKINKNNIINIKKVRKIAIHIAAIQPKYLNIKSISNKYIKKIKENIKIKFKNKLKHKNINNEIKEKLNKICLKEQLFLFKNNIKVKKYLKTNNIKVIKFYLLKSKNN